MSELAWHFLPDDGMTVTHHGGLPRTKVVPGLTLTHHGPLILCEQGLHASRRAIDALGYAQGSVVCRVEMGGVVIEGDDKLVAETRTVLWMGNATRILHEFACEVAEEALNLVASRGGEVDPRSRNAIAVKRRWLDGKASDSDLTDACDAAWAAACDAAWAAARDAAWDAARAAAWAAAWDAARDAAWAAACDAARAAARADARADAWADARAAAIERFNTRLEAMLTAAFSPAEAVAQ